MMHRLRIVSIVEGEGDEKAIPILIRRIAGTIDPGIQVEHINSIRRPADQLLRPHGLERDVELAGRMLGGRGSVFIVLDADDPKCPATLGPSLLSRARQARSDLSIGLVLAKQEYESWFVASAESLAGAWGFPDGLTAPTDPEGIQGAKEWLKRQMPRGQKYRETLHQRTLTERFDLELARQRADSFDKCYREVAKLVTLLREGHASEQP